MKNIYFSVFNPHACSFSVDVTFCFRLQYMDRDDLCRSLSQQPSHGVFLPASGLKHNRETQCDCILLFWECSIRLEKYHFASWQSIIFLPNLHHHFLRICFSASPLNSRARRRWALLYTLLKNPPLILRRKHNLSTATSSSPTQTETEVWAWVMASQIQNQQSAPQGIPEIIVTAEEDC